MSVLSRYCKKYAVSTSEPDRNWKDIHEKTQLIITWAEEDGDDDDDDGYDYAPAA